MPAPRQMSAARTKQGIAPPNPRSRLDGLKICFIFNRRAGRHAGCSSLLERINAFVAECRLTATVTPTEWPRHATELARRAVEDGCDLGGRRRRGRDDQRGGAVSRRNRIHSRIASLRLRERPRPPSRASERRRTGLSHTARRPAAGHRHRHSQRASILQHRGRRFRCGSEPAVQSHPQSRAHAVFPDRRPHLDLPPPPGVVHHRRRRHNHQAPGDAGGRGQRRTVWRGRVLRPARRSTTGSWI